MKKDKTEQSATAQPEENEEKKRRKKLEKWFRFLRFCYATVIRFISPIKKVGHTEKYVGGPYIFVGNHRSMFDVVPPAIAIKQPVHFIAKKELAEKSLGRWFTRKSGCILVNRDGNDVRALMQSMKYLKNGENICIFPEGTRNKTDEIFLPFKSGAATLSIKTQTPIVMIIQCRKIRLFRRNYVYYSEPFEFSEYYSKKLTDADIAETDERLRQMMLESYRKLDEMLKDRKKKKK